MNGLQLKLRSPNFGSVALSSEVPGTKYQKALVLICYPASLSGDQKVFVTWVLGGGAGTGDGGWVFVEHFTECESGVRAYKTLHRGEVNKQIPHR